MLEIETGDGQLSAARTAPIHRARSSRCVSPSTLPIRIGIGIGIGIAHAQSLCEFQVRVEEFLGCFGPSVFVTAAPTVGSSSIVKAKVTKFSGV